MNTSEIMSSVKAMITNNVRNKEVTDNTRLSDLNIDSMTMVVLATEIEEKYDISIDPSMIYDLNNVGGIANYISQTLGTGQD